MLYPQSNQFRQCIALDGLWDFRFDPEDSGREAGWHAGFEGGRPIAVPASWNEQLEDGRDYLGAAWYQTRFALPWGWQQRQLRLRFGSVGYMAEVWLNGRPLGAHEGGHLPFELALDEPLLLEDNLLVVRVEGLLAPDRIPPGNLEFDPRDLFGSVNYPATTYDFFPFCGIQRPVQLCALPYGAIDDLRVVSELDGQDGLVRVTLLRQDARPALARLRLSGHGAELSAELALDAPAGQALLRVPAAALWSPEAPNLYSLTVELLADGQPYDRYTLRVGIRTIVVEGDRLLLNGRPITLRGFGRHEDFPVAGRGYVPAVLVKDYALMQWVGANSFRTTHYPYAEATLDLADQLGYLVIAETPAVGLFFRQDGLERRLALCQQFTRELIARDQNHPSVIAWSLANEPHSGRPAAEAFLGGLCDLARELDPSRPVTLVSFRGLEERAFASCDFLCLNRYLGWYELPGRLDESIAALSRDLDAIHQRYGKPLLLSEFGADAIAGHHAQPPEMFSEEYQAELLLRYIQLLETKPYVVGQHVWNLCDFKTGQGTHRPGALNHKGVFTRDRRPKLAAHRLRELWQK